MDNRNNTIAGWVLGAGIAALGMSIVSGKMFHGEVPAHGKQGYAIQGVESGEAGAAAVVPVATLLASADAAKGAEIFKKCTACHTIDAGGANGIGPNLNGVLGKALASHAGFAYSDSLKAKGGNWTFDALNEWLTNPKKYAPGNKMTFAGLGNPEERASLLLYMNSMGSNLPLPTPPAEGAAPAEGEAAGKDAAAAAPAAAVAK